MAKKVRSDDDAAEIRIMFVDLKGSNATIQDAVRSVISAVKPTVVAMTPALPPQQRAAIEATIEEEVDESDGEQDEPAPPKKRTTNSSVKRPHKPPPPIELDLISGDISLEAFVKQKNPKNHTEKYLVIAYWLKYHRTINSISISHIHTCYRSLGWATMDDIGQIFRSGLNDIFSRADEGLYEITTPGESRVLRMGATKD
jgi:hypothetical protein